MKLKILNIVLVVAWAATCIGLLILYGTRAITLAAVGQICVVGLIILDLLKDDDVSESKHYSCDGCVHDLGGGRCRMNLEYECREGGGFEMWEEDERDT